MSTETLRPDSAPEKPVAAAEEKPVATTEFKRSDGTPVPKPGRRLSFEEAQKRSIEEHGPVYKMLAE